MSGVDAEEVADQVWVYAVELREQAETVPEGEQPILWRLLSTHVVETLAEALKMASWYLWRWQVEQSSSALSRARA